MRYDMRKAIRWSIPFLLVMVALGLALSTICCVKGTGGRPIAEVNGEKITQSEFLAELQRRHGADAVVELIDGMVVRQEAKRRGITLTDAEREAGLERAAARVGSMSMLTEKLDEAGIPLSAYRSRIETSLLQDKIVRDQIKVSDDEIRSYYADHKDEFHVGPRVRARMIFLTDRQSAEAIREVLDDPESSFPGLAKSISQDDATADRGGDMGYFEKGDYAQPITDAAFTMQPGQISDVIRVPDGWAILKVLDRKPAGVKDLDEVKSEIRHRIMRQKEPQARRNWLLKARKNADLSIANDDLRKDVMARLETVKPPPMPGQL